MKLKVALRWMVVSWLMGSSWWLTAQPDRLMYFPDSGRTYATMDPGQEILQRNILISNQAAAYPVSFSLSFDQNKWMGFALNPRFSSIFSLKGQEGCYFRIRTHYPDTQGGAIEVAYFLIRGKCYSVYWNQELKRWDLSENPCRRY